MDPYLERAGLWQGFHNSFIAYLNAALNQALPSRFLARAEARVYIDLEPPTTAIPDVSVFAVARNIPRASGGVATAARPITLPEEILLEERREAFLEILDRSNGNRVVMVIELLSPENKSGSGLAEYLRKQRRVLQSEAHLLELDFLRGGQHTVVAPELPGAHVYRISLADASRPGSAFVWRLGLRDALPVLELPLTEDASPVALDLQSVFDRCYEEGRYADLLDETYRQPLAPSPLPEDALWLQERIAAWSTSG
jgi:hypothetical protein